MPVTLRGSRVKKPESICSLHNGGKNQPGWIQLLLVLNLCRGFHVPLLLIICVVAGSLRRSVYSDQKQRCWIWLSAGVKVNSGAQ